MNKILYIGTGSFAIAPLKKLLGLEEVEIVGVVTQPDKPAGRKMEITPAPVKHFLNEEELDLRIFQPEKIRENAEDILHKTSPDLIIVAAYGQMIPKIMLETPQHGVWNLHGSLLPVLRGAVPVQRAILDGLKETGVTIQQMVEGLDEGGILMQESVSVPPDETSPQLMNKLSVLAAKMLPEAVRDLRKGNLDSVAQDETLATYCYQSDIEKKRAEVAWDTPVKRAESMTRALLPWPIAWFTISGGKHKGKRVKIFKARIAAPVVVQTNFGVTKEGKGLLLHLSDGVIQLEELQLEGKQKGSAKEYLYLGEK